MVKVLFLNFILYCNLRDRRITSPCRICDVTHTVTMVGAATIVDSEVTLGETRSAAFAGVSRGERRGREGQKEAGTM